MSRLVSPRSASGMAVGRLAADEGRGAGVKEYAERVAKYVPAEIIATFTTVNALLVPGAAFPAHIAIIVMWINFGLCAVLTPVYFWLIAKRDEPWVVQSIMSFIAFPIWAYNITGDNGLFGSIGLKIYYAPIAAALMAFFSLISGFIAPKATN